MGSDGTEDGTYMVKDIYPGKDSGFWSDITTKPIVFNDNVFFIGRTETTGKELWKSGTEEGTVLVKDLKEGTGDSSITHFTIFNDELFFMPDHQISTNLRYSKQTELRKAQFK